MRNIDKSEIEIYNFQFLCISINSHDSYVNDDDFHLTQDAWKYDEDVIRTSKGEWIILRGHEFDDNDGRWYIT